MTRRSTATATTCRSQPIGYHPKSGMPLTEEYRIFWLDGFPFFWSPYWEGADYGPTDPPIEQFTEVAAAVRSRFFTLDIARRRDGDWMAVELGDGQVSGLPSEADAGRFYAALAERWPEGSAKGPSPIESVGREPNGQIV